MPLVKSVVIVVLPIKGKISLSFQGELNKSNHEVPRWYIDGNPSLLFLVEDVNAVEKQDNSVIIRLNQYGFDIF